MSCAGLTMKSASPEVRRFGLDLRGLDRGGCGMSWNCSRRALTAAALALVTIGTAAPDANAAGAPSDRKTITSAGFTNHLAQLSTKTPRDFTVVLQPPFVVLGDEPAETVQRRATNTVKWAVDRLKLDYFKRDQIGRASCRERG